MPSFSKYKVDPIFYNKNYFLSKEYPESKNYQAGIYRLTPQLEKIYQNIKPTKKKLKFLDAGCGRGELLYFIAKKGYQVYGIDYSKDAVEMSQRLLKRKQIKGEVIKTDVSKIPFSENYFDLIVSTDVIEHLDDEKAAVNFLNEMYRILKPKGKFYLHTAPNRLYLDYFVKHYQRYLNFLIFHLANFLMRKKKYRVSLKIRTPTDKIVHVNEQTYFSLKRFLEKSLFKNYEIKIASYPLSFSLWKIPYYVFAYFYPLNRISPFNIILGNHLYFLAKK